MKKDFIPENLLSIEQRLTPEQVLILKILQTPKFELLNNINNEIEQNPSLTDVEEEELQDIEEVDIEEMEIDTELKEIVKDDFLTYFLPEKDEEKFLEIPAPKPKLKEYLKQELGFITSDEELLRIGEYVIELLDEHGFLFYEPEEIAKDLNVEAEKVLKVLEIIRDIEPKGFGLRGAREFLLFQIRMNYLDEKCETIILDCYEEFLKNDLSKISKKLKIDIKEVKGLIDKIKNLKPYPTNYEFGEVEYIIPDVFVEIEKEELIISINEIDLPYLTINPKYLEILKEEKKYDRETVNFVKEKVKRPLLFIKGLEMRRNIFRKLVEFILNEQKDFITKGAEYKKPLRLKDVSERLGINISTCSRILKGVYVQIGNNVYNIKEFFSLPSGKKNEISRDKVKMLIKKIISEEKKPLKDTEIQSILKDMGINVDRRTISKYRDEMKIPAYNLRRRSYD